MQFITHYTERYSYLDAAHMALEGGCRWVQLRMKDTLVETIEPVALEVQALCRQYGATFIIDDHVELVKKLHADGVHLGKKDMPIAEARRILGDEYIIGGTANTFEDVQQHYKAGADYIGCGPFRYTTTKKNLSPILGWKAMPPSSTGCGRRTYACPWLPSEELLSQTFPPLCRPESAELPYPARCCMPIVRQMRCGESFL